MQAQASPMVHLNRSSLQTPKSPTNTNAAPLKRVHVEVQGAVQGVGFRPFIYGLAHELKLGGWVKNTGAGATFEIEGPAEQLQVFLARCQTELPAPAEIQALQVSEQNVLGHARFEISLSDPAPIISSVQTGASRGTSQNSSIYNRAVILPDLATCPDCLQELFEKTNRRFHYPFINCTHCGPRFSIIRALPYDRPSTTMAKFTLCRECQAEYDSPLDRRFHAQPNACACCGPQLQWWAAESEQSNLSTADEPLEQAAAAICAGQIVAFKGVGGFQLLVDARNETAIVRLRQRKRRPAKPFAVMYPTLEDLAADCAVSKTEAELLRSPQAPIVLLQQKQSNALADGVAPGNPNLGVMLPYSPLHHLLLQRLGFAVVATSGNRSSEPLCIDNDEARQRLQGIADGFLVHNRPIQRPVDDSVARLVSGQLQVLRRARGFAPLPITMPRELAGPCVLAVGAQQKTTIALSVDNQIFVSQHLGDLETVESRKLFESAIADFQDLYHQSPVAIACDAHPDYPSSQFAKQLSEKLRVPLIPVQHHYAHSLACMAEHQLEGTTDPPLLSLAWDGTGDGRDGTIWGGELLQITSKGFERVGHLLPFRLSGGEVAIREPRRAALGLLYGCFGNALFDPEALPLYQPFLDSFLQQFTASELQVMQTMLSKPLNAPLTSSGGRLFDGVAAIAGLLKAPADNPLGKVSFEGQAAMALEFAMGDRQFPEGEPKARYSLPILLSDPLIWDWRPMIREILMDIQRGTSAAQISHQFHNSLIEAMVEAVSLLAPANVAPALLKQRRPPPKVLLTGGCFQNRYLTDRLFTRLQVEGFEPYWHQQLPPNDGSISVGQILAAWRSLRH